jgi:mono/diheme cytochrome c family protein
VKNIVNNKLNWISPLLFVFPMVAYAQQARDPLSSEVVQQGKEVYGKACTFCHGEAGNGGSGPRLSGRGFDSQYIDRVVQYGVPETAMAPWGQRLTAPDVVAVSSYIKALNGIVLPPSTNALRALTGEAGRGRDFFFDATKELGGCSNCHAVSGRGVAVAPEIKDLPSDTVGLRNLATPRLRTAQVSDETFPAIVVTELKSETRLFDLTTVPPVLRTFSPSSVKLREGSTWQHSSAVGAYSNQELELVLAFLRATVRR